MFEQEFTELYIRFTIVVRETTKYVPYFNQILRLMNRETVQANNHYEVPLSLKSADVTFPNNTSDPINILNWLKRCFIKDKSFHEMYKIFIDDMLE